MDTTHPDPVPPTPPPAVEIIPELFQRDIGRRSVYVFLLAVGLSLLLTLALWLAQDRVFAALGGVLPPQRPVPPGLFIPEDLRDVPALAARLRPASAASGAPGSGGELGGYLRGRFPEPLNRALNLYQTTNAPESLLTLLVPALNDVLRADDLYAPGRFHGMDVPHELASRAAARLDEAERVEVNRRLLEAAFPSEFAPAGRAVTPPGDASSGAFWAYKLLYEGPITYSIIAAILVAAFYSIGLLPARLIPFGLPVTRDIDRLHARLDQTPPGSLESLGEAAEAAGLDPRGRLRYRLEMLDRVGQVTREPETLRSANDRLTAVEEAGTAYALQPLVYIEWLLPILGFLGTVWGVTGAVDGLRSGILTLFQQKSLGDAVLAQFMVGFRGLVLAFDTTLFGLIGLGLTGSINFFLRKSASYVLLNIDKWSNEAIGRLKPASDKLEELLRTGLFVTDEHGELVLDERDHKPVLQLRKLVETLQDLVRQGFFETNERGELVTTDGRPVLRWQAWMDQMVRGLFVTDPRGALLLSERDHSPVPRSAYPLRQLVRMLTQELYEVSPERAQAVAEGVNEETGEEVPLRSRHERRHVELVARLNLLAVFLDRALVRLAAGGGTGQTPGGPQAPAWFLVLPGEGLPVDALTVTGEHFAIARQKAPASESDFRFHTGTIASHVVGSLQLPMVLEDLAAPERVHGIVGLADRLAYLGVLSGEVAVGGWEASRFPVSCSLPPGSRLVPHAVGLMPYDRISQVLVLDQTETTARLLAWPVEGSAPALSVIREMPGQAMAFACLPGRLAACVVGNDHGYRLYLVRPDGVAEVPGFPDVTALTFAPDGTLWCADADGNVALLNTNAAQLEVRFQTGRKLAWLAVAGTGQVLAAERNSRELLVLDTAQRPRALQCASPITALTASPEGHHLLVGHEDGSVHHLDLQQRL